MHKLKQYEYSIYTQEQKKNMLYLKIARKIHICGKAVANLHLHRRHDNSKLMAIIIYSKSSSVLDAAVHGRARPQ